MSEYLSKEEIKQWRSSLEKITLEEFAARLGKKIEETKPTNDLVDIVLKGKPVVSTDAEWMQSRTERLSSIAERAMMREREISPTPFSISRLKSEEVDVSETSQNTINETKIEKTAKQVKTKKSQVKPQALKEVKSTKSTKRSAVSKVEYKSAKPDTLREEVRIVFKKALTDREQKVFDHFCEHSNQIVYAKDLAALLDLPRDYVYKYIKNLRAKIDGENLQNADKGGFILNV